MPEAAPGDFGPCEICGAADWVVVHHAPVRDGAFGRLSSPDARVGRCGGCGAERLHEHWCPDPSIYESADYRALLGQGQEAADFLAGHDHLQLRNLTAVWPFVLRGKVCADVGCAAGSFLDHVSGVVAETIGIEPCEGYHPSLRDRGHVVYPDTRAALADRAHRVDVAVSFSVIEHVLDPRAFLSEIGALLRPGGRLFVSTPNRRDVLMTLLPDAYASFFYRTVHRWYFDEASFARCAEQAGLRVHRSTCVHRFGLSNALVWLRDRRPSQDRSLADIDSALLSGAWKAHLEQIGQGDYLFFELGRAEEG